MRILQAFILLIALCLAPVSASGANFAFVFHASATTVSIYDADSLTLRATPTVGTGAVRAFGIPDPNNPVQFLKFYVVTTSSIVALDPASFAVRGTVGFAGSLATGPNTAVLIPNGQKLLLVTGGQVQILNTTDATEGTLATIAPAPTPTAIVVTPDSRRAYVLSAGSPIIQIIDLTQNPPSLLATTVNLPVGSFPTAIGMAPNGSRLYAGSASPPVIFEIDLSSNAVAAAIANPGFSGPTNISFDPDPAVSNAVFSSGPGAPVLNLPTRALSSNPFTMPGGATIARVVLPGANRAFFLAGSPARLFQGFIGAGGPASEVINPQTAVPFGPNAVDMDATPDGSRLFVAFSDSRLLKLDPSGSVLPSQVTPPQPPSGLSLAYGPVAQATILDIYGGNIQNGPANTTFPTPLAVRARNGGIPAFKQTIAFTSSTAGVSFSDANPVTNLLGVAETFVQAPVTTAVQIQAVVVPVGSASPVTFTLNSGSTPANPQGLVKISGDRQIVLQSTAFPVSLIVQATPGATLTPSVTPLGFVTFTATMADVNGMATITCTAGVVLTSPTAVSIQVTDSVTGATLSDPFRATIVGTAAELPTDLSLATQPSPLVAAAGQTISNAVLVRAIRSNGSTVPDIGVVLSSLQNVVFNPSVVVTDAPVSVTFGCFLGPGSISARLLAPMLPSRSVGFTTTRGPVAQMFKRQGDNQRGNAGQRLDGPGQALRVQVTDVCGNNLAGEPVAWTVSSAGAATLENIVSTTDFDGNASVLVRLGNIAGAFTVTASSSGVSATFSLTVNILPTRLVASSGNNQTVVLGQAAGQPLVVQVQDDNGTGVPGVDVTFTASAGTATLSASRVTTDAQGRASVAVTVGNALGAVTITASAINRTVTFTITTVGRVPVATTLGFVNSASFRVGWVPGSAGSIFGVGLMEGVTGVVQSDRAPFPTTLRGVRVTVEGIEAPIISLVNVQGQEQINLQVPVNLTPGVVTVVIFNNGSSTTIPGVRILPIQPGIFEFDSGGTRLAAALHLDFSVVTQANPARPGEIIVLFLTGLGATTPPVQTNVAGPVPPLVTVTKPTVGINDGGTEVLGSFYVPTLFTAYQINFVMPLSIGPGLVKLSVVADGVPSQDSRIPVGPPR